jgi:SAM-dependent methyltransferase
VSHQLEWTGERLVPTVQGDVACEHLHRYALACELVKGKVVLDIACGEGYGSSLLARNALEVIGVDISADVVAHARAVYPHDNLSFRTGTCSDIPVASGSIDVVVSFETLEHHDRHHEMMAEMRRVLRPGGALVISTPDKRTYSDIPGYANPFHVRELYREDFENLLRQYFHHVMIVGQRMCHGSLIAPLADQPGIGHANFRGNFSVIREHRGFVDARYVIGLAWDDGEPPQLREGLFEGDDLSTDLDQLAFSRGVEVGHLRREVAWLEEAFRQLDAVFDRIAALAPDRNDLSRRIGEIKDEFWYWRLIHRLRAVAAAAIPADATVLVISRGDERLLSLAGRRGWHFPRDERGDYAGGYPADDAEAIQHLEALRTDGADYFLVPSSGQWWLRDYPTFGRHVRDKYPAVATSDDVCSIFDLHPGRNGLKD